MAKDGRLSSFVRTIYRWDYVSSYMVMHKIINSLNSLSPYRLALSMAANERTNLNPSNDIGPLDPSHAKCLARVRPPTRNGLRFSCELSELNPFLDLLRVR